MITSGLVYPVAATFDAAGHLYVSDEGNTSGRIVVFAPPYTGAPLFCISNTSQALRGIAVDAHGNLYVGDLGTNGVNTGMVHVYQAPLTSISTVAFDIVTGVNSPEELSMDNAGDLYVASAVAPSPPNVYAPPFSKSSAPKLTVGSVESDFGIAIGP